MSKPVILCVDDENIVLISLKEQLKRALGDIFSIEMAESGEEALEIFEELMGDKKEIVVILSDQIMPGMKGDVLLNKVHALSPSTMAILLTGQANLEDVGNAINGARLYRYLSKPWEERDLTLTVTEATRAYKQDKELQEQNIKLEELNKELKQKVDTFYKFVPAPFIKILNPDKEIEHIELGSCVELDMTILFSDIRSFTTLSESISPSDVFEFINQYLAQMGRVIHAHDGFIDKYIGDAIMALFDNVDHSLDASVGMFNQLQDYNKSRAERGRQPVHIGVGLNYGNVMMGTIGESGRLQTTVLGDSVNVSARIESLTKTYGAPLLISEDTFKKISDPNKYTIRKVDHVTVKGKTTYVTVYEVLDGQPDETRKPKEKLFPIYEKALSQFHHREFAEAKKGFEKCLSILPTENCSQLYLRRCDKMLAKVGK